MLLEIPGLVRLYDGRDATFRVSVKEWLEQTVVECEKNRMSVSGELSTLKGKMISAERGVLPLEYLSLRAKSVRRALDAMALDILARANQSVNDALKPSWSLLADGEKLARQIVTLAIKKGTVRIDAKPEENWRSVSNDSDLGGYATALVGLVGLYDAIILVDRAIPEVTG